MDAAMIAELETSSLLCTLSYWKAGWMYYRYFYRYCLEYIEGYVGRKVMTKENFCYWLQGWMEIQNPQEINARQMQEIKNHLNLVFNKVTPSPSALGGSSFGGMVLSGKPLEGFFQISC